MMAKQLSLDVNPIDLREPLLTAAEAAKMFSVRPSWVADAARRVVPRSHRRRSGTRRERCRARRRRCRGSEWQGGGVGPAIVGAERASRRSVIRATARSERALLAEPTEGGPVVGDEALSKCEIARAQFGESGPERADVVIVEGIARLEVSDDLRQEHFADTATGHGRRVSGATVDSWRSPLKRMAHSSE
jgi:hypothetical protein